MWPSDHEVWPSDHEDRALRPTDNTTPKHLLHSFHVTNPTSKTPVAVRRRLLPNFVDFDAWFVTYAPSVGQAGGVLEPVDNQLYFAVEVGTGAHHFHYLRCGRCVYV